MDSPQPEPAPAPAVIDESLTRSPRFRWALALLVLSYAIGWPVVGLAAAASPWVGVENAALLGSGSYALSWAVLGLSTLLGGREVAVYAERRWRERRRVKTEPTAPPP